MKKVNLKYLYPDVYTDDFIVEVKDNVYKELKTNINENLIDYGLVKSFMNIINSSDYSFLYSLFDELTLKQQNRIYEAYILEISKAEIARIEGCSEAAIRHAINRGLYKMRRKLKNYKNGN